MGFPTGTAIRIGFCNSVGVDLHGAFPFGRPNTVRPARLPKKPAAAAAVVGVYPSAWHVSWRAPAHLASPTRKGSVAALAVDVEPTVFWNGDPRAFPEMLAEWKATVGFVDGDELGAHGWISDVQPPANGSSGAKVEERYLRPLGIASDAAAFTDVYPVFVVKSAGRGRGRREQGDAIRDEYDAIADRLGTPPSSLPARPTARELVASAVRLFHSQVLHDLEAADPARVISLGDESLQVLRQIPELKPAPPAATITDLYGADRYGRPGQLTINGRPVQWLALAHPGLLKGKPKQVEIHPQKRSGAGWNWLHDQWVSRRATSGTARRFGQGTAGQSSQGSLLRGSGRLAA